MNENNDNNKNNKESDLFEFLKYMLGCTYISDLKIKPYNAKARLIFRFLDFKKYPMSQVKDAFEYLYSENEN